MKTMIQINSENRLFGTQKITPQGHLEVGGVDTVQLASEFGTPLYVIDEAFLRENMRQYRKAFETRGARANIAYASKAFLTTAMAKIVDQEGLCLDVASAGELHTALKGGFPARRIYQHGNNKSISELEMALDCGVGRIIVDNGFELDNLIGLASSRGIVADILIRVTPGVDPHTHRLISVGQEDTKFGCCIKDGTAMAVAQKAAESPHVNTAGFHCHVGSQLMDATSQVEAADVMCSFVREFKDITGHSIDELNMGGGLGISYIQSHKPQTIDGFVADVLQAVRSGLAKYGLEEPAFGLEPGRSIIGQAGITLYEVGAIKTVPISEEPGARTYVNIDGGMSDNPRPQLYDSVYEALVASRADQPRDWRVRISGKHCETDILIQDTFIQKCEPGDILAVQGTGAYNYAMASNYNRLTRPAVVLVNDGKADIIVRRESLDDLLSHDIIPDRLA